MDIVFDKVGKIMSGQEKGHYVKFIEDTKNTGGYLILTSSTIDMLDGFDNWVESADDMKRYISESNWVIEWTIS